MLHGEQDRCHIYGCFYESLLLAMNVFFPFFYCLRISCMHIMNVSWFAILTPSLINPPWPPLQHLLPDFRHLIFLNPLSPLSPVSIFMALGNWLSPPPSSHQLPQLLTQRLEFVTTFPLHVCGLSGLCRFCVCVIITTMSICKFGETKYA